jgi:hypothetical protein
MRKCADSTRDRKIALDVRTWLIIVGIVGRDCLMIGVHDLAVSRGTDDAQGKGSA